MHCLVLKKIDPSYIVCMKLDSTFLMLSPPVLASSCSHEQDFSKWSSFHQQKHPLSFHPFWYVKIAFSPTILGGKWWVKTGG